MAMRLLKSLSTGVVVPYTPAALKHSNVREMTAAEVQEYLASMNVEAPAVEAEPEPVVEAEPEPVVEAEPEPVVETGKVVTRDYEDGEPDADEVLAALEVD